MGARTRSVRLLTILISSLLGFSFGSSAMAQETPLANPELACSDGSSLAAAKARYATLIQQRGKILSALDRADGSVHMFEGFIADHKKDLLVWGFFDLSSEFVQQATASLEFAKIFSRMSQDIASAVDPSKEVAGISLISDGLEGLIGA